MKIVWRIAVAVWLLLAAVGCGMRENDSDTLKEDVESQAECAVRLYQEFIAGECSVDGIRMEDLITLPYYPEHRYTTEYTMLDINGDDIPELHIRTVNSYTIFTCENGSLSRLSFENFHQDAWAFCLLENGGFIERIQGNWYTSDTTSYDYFELDLNGNRTNIRKIWWQDINQNGCYDEEDRYCFGEECTKEEWLDAIKEYLYTGEDGGVHICNQVRWQIYCEDSAIADSEAGSGLDIEWLFFDDGYGRLADGVELSAESREAFLCRYGFGDSEPTYTYNGSYMAYGGDEKAYSLELYYDAERVAGCAILCWEEASGPLTGGFVISGDNILIERNWDALDVFSTLSVEDGETGEKRVEDYSEEYEYDEAGKLLSFRSFGTYDSDEGKEYGAVITVDFTYDEQGNLKKKKQTDNFFIFGTPDNRLSWYDESGRLVLAQTFLVHTNEQEHYIYLDDGPIPAYGLALYSGTPRFIVYR